ncbi:hypothetical protein AGDE_06936 [Angomonas deanei]|uniref:CCDC113/CCDC96 coiled-coil domain-containing protein n=1 Tax=Angomonas deanei TaxID=59799 RepID=S9VW25_9TRYP|nr:hypothetical protein AGDE_09162 [Angomonas deanei]EPY36392.1 hypothetical protein AGDE_06936 [Angomonas deanei]CAD2220343.1 Domain of unknown function (DUF4201), putative [Angomonas deanei]|eukprot:EPY31221.1 hypothetical protein AGDE_09162 [Angomonas deanei]
MHDDQEEIINEALMQENNFREYIKELSGSASYMRSNRPMSAEALQQLLDQEAEQRAKIREARIRLIKLQNFSKKVQVAMDEKDKQSKHTGMYLIDFEQLKIENTNLSEKIEERNEDISKLRRKVTTTIHVLTHMKEKLEFMRDENEVYKGQVASTEEELSVIRDQLARTKRRRDGYAASNVKMKERMPLVGSDDLLLDYENRKEAINKARMQVVQLTEKHKELHEFIQKNQPVIDELQRTLSNYPK